MKTAKVAPPSVFTSPNLATPTTWNVRTGPSAATRIESPGAKCFLEAVSLSITTSPGCWAQRPSVSRNGLKRSASRSSPKPNVGLPDWLMTLPLRSMSFAWSELPEKSRIVPAASCTSGSARIFATSAEDTDALPLNE